MKALPEREIKRRIERKLQGIAEGKFQAPRTNPRSYLCEVCKRHVRAVRVVPSLLLGSRLAGKAGQRLKGRYVLACDEKNGRSGCAQMLERAGVPQEASRMTQRMMALGLVMAVALFAMVGCGKGSSLGGTQYGPNTFPEGTWHDYPDAASGVITEAGAALYRFSCQSHDNSTDYVFVQNSPNALATEAGPNPYSYLLPAGGILIVGNDALGNGRQFPLGIAYGVSSAANGYYAVTALPDCQFNTSP